MWFVGVEKRPRPWQGRRLDTAVFCFLFLSNPERGTTRQKSPDFSEGYLTTCYLECSRTAVDNLGVVCFLIMKEDMWALFITQILVVASAFPILERK